MINQWENVTNIECPDTDLPCPKDGHVILEIYNFSEVKINIGIKPRV